MKKILIFSVITLLIASCVGTNKIPEGKETSRTIGYTPLSTILTWYETGDKPTQDQFEDSWGNSYNSVSDGMFDLTGYPSIGFAPYTSYMQGKFYQAAGYPTDTTVSLSFGGMLKVAGLWVDGQKYTGGGGGAWTLSGTDLYPTSLTSNVAINATSAAGYDLFVGGSTYSTSRIRTNTFEAINTLGDEAFISVDASGNMQFQDETTASPVTLSSLMGSSAWSRTNNTIYPTWGYDTLILGHAVYGMQDSMLTVLGTAKFRKAVYFDSTVHVNGVLKSDIYVETPSLNFSYAGNSGNISLYSGKMRFYDSENLSGVTLTELQGGYFDKNGDNIYTANSTDNLVIGSTTAAVSLFDLYVAGNTWTGGYLDVGGGINLAGYGKVQFTDGYITTGAGGLTFNDSHVGTKTLSELAGIYADSISVSYLNVDTMYFNGTTNRKIFSPWNNDIYFGIDAITWRMQAYHTGTDQRGIFSSDVYKFNKTTPDAFQTYIGFEELGTLYLSATDTNFVYNTGKVGEWRVLATEDYVDDVLSGGLGTTPTFDTVYYAATEYMTKTPSVQEFKFASTAANGDTMTFNFGASPYIGSARGTSIEFDGNDSLIFNVGLESFIYDGTYWRNSTDTLSTRAYSRSFGGGGGAGTPGGSSGDLQYNNAGAFGGFWDYNGTNITAANGTGFLWGSNASLKGYDADSVSVDAAFHTFGKITNTMGEFWGTKSVFENVSGYVDQYSFVYSGYTNAMGNNGLSYGVYSNLYTGQNYSASGYVSESSAGNFVLNSDGTVVVGGAGGTVIYSGVSGVIDGIFSSTGGSFILTGVYGKDSNVGNAGSYAGFFDGKVAVLGDIDANGDFSFGGTSESGMLVTSDWMIDILGELTGISGITNDAAITSTGGIVSLNASSNYAVNIATGTSTGAISIGGGSNTVAVNSSSWDITTAGAVSGLTTLSMSGQLTSTLATGTSPFAVTSTTVNTNLNADLLDGQTGSYYQTATNLTAGTIPGDRGITAGSSSSSFVEYNGTTHTAGQFYGGTALPTGTTRLNYAGYLYSTRNYADRYYSNELSAITDTMAAVWYPGGYLDSASLVIAANGWEIELEDFDTYYSEAERLQALPLPYPNGNERRRPNALYANYQFEFELERLTRYLKLERDDKKVLEERIAVLEKQIGVKAKKNRKNRR